MDIPVYIVQGINPNTNRKNTKRYSCLDEAVAISNAKNDGLVEPFEVECPPPSPASTRQIDYAISLGIPIPINATKDEMSRRITAAVDYEVDFSKFHPVVGQGWQGWPQALHKQPEQLRRLERAKSFQYVPLEISASMQAALFAPSDKTKAPYLTTLESCHCLDFYRTGKPCKHMYRLANELFAIVAELESSFKSDMQAAHIKPLREKTPFILAMLLFLYPFGLYLLWRYSVWDKKLKGIAAVAFGVIFMLALLASGS